MTAAHERRTMARLSVAAGSAATLAAAWLGILRIEGGPPTDASAEVALAHGVTSGTDSDAPIAAWLYFTTTAALTLVIVLRLAIAIAPRRRPERRMAG